MSESGRKTIGELYREHEIRVEVGHDEGKSAIRFAEAVRIVAGIERRSVPEVTTIHGRPVIEVDDLNSLADIIFLPMNARTEDCWLKE